MPPESTESENAIAPAETTSESAAPAAEPAAAAPVMAKEPVVVLDDAAVTVRQLREAVTALVTDFGPTAKNLNDLSEAFVHSTKVIVGRLEALEEKLAFGPVPDGGTPVEVDVAQRLSAIESALARAGHPVIR